MLFQNLPRCMTPVLAGAQQRKLSGCGPLVGHLPSKQDNWVRWFESTRDYQETVPVTQRKAC